LSLLGSEIGRVIDRPFTYSLSRGYKLAACSLGETVRASPVEYLVSPAEFVARFMTPVLAAEPLAVD
jgi:hypothetical protein